MSAAGATAQAWDPLILSVAPNGARKTHADHPALPIAPEELALCAARCRHAGAAMIHLHVRDAEGGHTLDVGRYREAIAAIRGEVGEGIVIQVTSEAVGRYTAAEQMAMVVELQPEAVSLAIRELLPAEGGDERSVALFLADCWMAGVLVQFICYDAADLARLALLQQEGTVPPGRLSVLYVLGRYTPGQRSQPADLLPFLAAGGSQHLWSLCAFGAQEAACATAALTLGGHARIGFENNLLLPDGRTAEDNAASVAVVADIARRLARPLADAATARRLMAPAAGE